MEDNSAMDKHCYNASRIGGVLGGLQDGWQKVAQCVGGLVIGLQMVCRWLGWLAEVASEWSMAEVSDIVCYISGLWVRDICFWRTSKF